MLVVSQMRQLGMEGKALHSVDTYVLKARCGPALLKQLGDHSEHGSPCLWGVQTCGVAVGAVGAARSRGWLSGNP